MGKAGIEPAMFTARVADLQSAAFANYAYLPILMTDTGLEPHIRLSGFAARHEIESLVLACKYGVHVLLDESALISVGRFELPKPWFLAKYVCQIPSHGRMTA